VTQPSAADRALPVAESPGAPPDIGMPALGPGSPAVPTSAPVADLARAGAFRSLLSIRAFRRLWLVLGLSSLGDWLGLLATSTFATQQVSGSAAKGVAFGSIIAVRLLPALVLGPLAGVVADRWDRRYTMVVCDLVRFVLWASIPGITLFTQDAKLVVGWAAAATFVIEAMQMAWAPAKEAAVPNLLPRRRLELANQLTLATTYGFAPVAAGLLLAGLTTVTNSIHRTSAASGINPTHLALYFNAITFLATALTVFFGIKEISGRAVARPDKKPSMLHEFAQGWRYVGRTPLVRGLVLGILGAFAGAGVVVGTAQFYARSLAGGDSTFYILFAILFVGLGIGIVAGPRLVRDLSRRRWFGLSIILAAASVTGLAFAWHLMIAVLAALGVGVGAGMAFLSGTTLLGREVTDDVRGRVFSFIQTSNQVALLLTISLSSVVVGVGGSRQLHGVPISTTRLLLLAAGAFGMIAGIGALHQMDDKKGVPLLADIIGSLRGRPLPVVDQRPLPGRFIVFEGGEGAGKSTQVARLAELLRRQGRDVVVTREPGATDVGAAIRGMLLDPGLRGLSMLTPRAEALLYAADRAHHVTTVVRPALERGSIVISDRYVDSSLAYQGAGRTLPVAELARLSEWATDGLKPDLVVLLDIDPAIGLARAYGRGDGADRLESEELAFHDRVRFAFQNPAAADPQRYVVLDADRPADELAAIVAARVASLLPPVAEHGVSPEPDLLDVPQDSEPEVAAEIEPPAETEGPGEVAAAAVTGALAEAEAPAETGPAAETGAPSETEAPVESGPAAETGARAETDAPVEVGAQAEIAAAVETEAPADEQKQTGPAPTADGVKRAPTTSDGAKRTAPTAGGSRRRQAAGPGGTRSTRAAADGSKRRQAATPNGATPAPSAEEPAPPADAPDGERATQVEPSLDGHRTAKQREPKSSVMAAEGHR
jgi:dTMP kinase